MRRLLLYCLVAFALVACGKIETFITYDPVEMHGEPSRESDVVVKITCSPKPGSSEFDKKNRVLYWNGPQGNPIPLSVTKKDKSGGWGYVRIFSMEAREQFKGWLPLGEMLPCGGGLGDEVREVYTARQNKVMLYKHPSAHSGEQTRFWLNRGDTVQVLSADKGWVHVHRVSTYTNVDDPELYGWAQVAQLESIGSFSANSVAADNRAAESGIKAGLSLDIWRLILLIGGAASLLVFLVMIIPSRKRSKFMSDLVFKVLVGVALCAAGVWGTQHLSVDIMDSLLVLVVPLLVYSILYPLLYNSGFAPFWKYLYAVLAIACAVLVFLPATRHLHGHGIHKAYFGVAVAALVFVLWRILRIWKNVSKNVCPNCGYYASQQEGKDIVDHEERSEPWTERVSHSIHTGDKVTYSGYQEIKREAQYRTEFSTVTKVRVTRHYHCDFSCSKCGHSWRKTWTETEVETIG